MKIASWVIRAVSGGVLLLQCACIGSTPPATFYLLEPLATGAAPTTPEAAAPLLVLVPVRIPQYLQRAELVTASGRNTYELDELHRWAEALDDNISRVMLQDLAALIPADVVPASSPRSRQSELRLSVTVLEFHINPQDQAKLTVQWQLADGSGSLLAKLASYSVAAGSGDAQAKVFALNQCLYRLDSELAAELKALFAQDATVTTRQRTKD